MIDQRMGVREVALADMPESVRAAVEETLAAVERNLELPPLRLRWFALAPGVPWRPTADDLAFASLGGVSSRSLKKMLMICWDTPTVPSNLQSSGFAQTSPWRRRSSSRRMRRDTCGRVALGIQMMMRASNNPKRMRARTRCARRGQRDMSPTWRENPC